MLPFEIVLSLTHPSFLSSGRWRAWVLHLAECRCKASAKLQKVHIRVMIKKWRELSSSHTVLRLEKSSR